MTNALSPREVERYARDGYLAGFRVFSEAEIHEINREFQRLLELLPADKTAGDICQWHEHDKFLYDICAEPRLLEFVEDLIGPNFYLWGSHFFAKLPHDPTAVAWHQDAFYWPLEPREAVTVWLAFTDSDAENGCLRIIPGSHLAGMLRHQRSSGTQANALWLELEGGQFSLSNAKNVELRAGEISLHDDHIVHGSEGNLSDRWRVGLAIRYSPAHVKCDLGHWPRFLTFPVRGDNRKNMNPMGARPQSLLTHFVQTPPMSTLEARERLMSKRGMVLSK
jgi:non-haem Fe2+, alpha-ketoglutarate-dependent halogenase